MKQAARRLDELPQSGRDFALVQVLFEETAVARLPEVNVDDLRGAWLMLLGRAAANRHHRITRNQLSVREHMSGILRLLREKRMLEFTELFQPSRGVAVLVVTLLALLELARELLVEITQAECFAPIYVKLAYAQPV